MKKIPAAFLLALIVLSVDGCSYLTTRGRQEAAYARYVRRSSAGRLKMQRSLASFPKLPKSQPANEPQVMANAGPESVTLANESQ